MKTPFSLSRAVIKEKKSKFIGLLYPVDSQVKVSKHLKNIGWEYHDATHICYGYRICLSGASSMVEGQSDAREPSGTAGMPILVQLRHHEIINALLIVVRYYGGIKLGKGGLARTYSSCASAVIDDAKFRKVRPTVNYQLRVPFEHTGIAENVIQKYRGTVIKREYGDVGLLKVDIPVDLNDEFSLIYSSALS